MLLIDPDAEPGEGQRKSNQHNARGSPNGLRKAEQLMFTVFAVTRLLLPSGIFLGSEVGTGALACKGFRRNKVSPKKNCEN